MRLTDDVVLPDEVADALEEGNLVFFVGAGASKSAPANLPDFAQLLDGVAQRANVDPLDHSKPFDETFGDLERQKINVNSMAADLTNVSGSSPNQVHKAIARLAAESKSPKIVTTNFDVLLNEALKEKLSDFSEWFAPALPLGDNFEGIVQLHGSVKGNTRDFVLTDRSFGEAYITRGWATQFLTDLFASHVVVFVGYSYEDPIMKYLARALPPATRRYAFVGIDGGEDSGKIQKFVGLGIQPISYPSRDHHQALPVALEQWASIAENDWFDRRRRVKTILRAIDGISELDEDYLKLLLQSNDGLGLFCSICKTLSIEEQQKIFAWCRRIPMVSKLFSQRTAAPELPNLEPLAGWLASYFLYSQKTLDEFWVAVEEFGNEISHELFESLERACHYAHDASAAQADLVFEYLHTSVPGISCWTPNATYSVCQQIDRVVTIPELSGMLTTRVEPLAPLLSDRSRIRFRLCWNMSTFDIRAAIRNVPVEHKTLLIGTVESAILNAQLLIKDFEGEEGVNQLGGWIVDLEGVSVLSLDPLSALLDFLVGLCKSNSITETRRLRWWGSQVSILKRISLVCLKFQADFSEQSKINWVLRNCDDLLDPSIRNEALSVIGACMPAADIDLRDEVFDRILCDSKSGLDTYRALRIVSGNTSEWERCRVELSRLELQDDEVRRVVNEAMVSEARQFFDIVHNPLEDAEEVGEFLDQFSSDDRDAVRDVITAEVSRFSARFPEQVLTLAANAVDVNSPLAKVVTSAAIGCLTGRDVRTGSAKFAELCGRAGEDEFYQLSRLIAEAAHEARDSEIDDMEKSIQNLWSGVTEGRIKVTLADEFPRWPGYIADGLAGLAQAKWRVTKSRSQTADWFVPHAEKLLSDEKLLPNTVYVFSRHLTFLLRLVPGFVTKKLLPYFDEPVISRYAWEGYLRSPVLTNQEPVRSETKRLLEKGWRNFGPDDELQLKFFETILAAIGSKVFSTNEIQELLGRGALVSDDLNRAEFIEYIAWSWSETSVAKLWHFGLKDYIFRRLSYEPVALEREERQAIANFPLMVPEVAAELIPEIILKVNFESLVIDEPALPQWGLTKEWDLGTIDLAASYLLSWIRSEGISAYAETVLIRQLEDLPRLGQEAEKLLTHLSSV